VLADDLLVFRNNGAHSRQLRGAWWPVGLSDKATFYNVLANSRLYMLKELTGAFIQQDDALSLSHQNTAFRLMGEKMEDPKQHDSDELLGSIGSFMCHQVRLNQRKVITFTDVGSTYWESLLAGSIIATPWRESFG